MKLLRVLFPVLVLALALSGPADAATPDGRRWFQVEISIFTNDSLELDGERWRPENIQLGFPERIRRLSSLQDLLYPDDLEELLELDLPLDRAALEPEPEPEDEIQEVSTGSAPIRANLRPTLEPVMPGRAARVGPQPRALGQFRLPDYETDPFLLLPPALHNFRQTNAALERSPGHRLLFHGAWRQPVTGPAEATSILITEGREAGGRHELEGSLTFRFNAGEDRVVLDANLWLSDFRTIAMSEVEWELPELPGTPQDEAPEETPRRYRAQDGDTLEYFVNRIVQLNQSREMRSNEFHYLDHPGIGIVVEVHPYVMPPPPLDGAQ